MTRRALRAAAAALLGAVLVVAPGAVRAGASAPAGSVGLLGQTAAVQGSGTFTLHLSINSPAAGDELQLLEFGQVFNRTNFDAALAGHMHSYARYSTVALDHLPADPAGGVDVSVPVNQAAPSGSPFSPWYVSAAGVYPVQAELVDPTNGVVDGTPLTTFLVWAPTTPVKPLSVAVVVPFTAAPAVAASGSVAALPGAESQRLNGLAQAVNADSSVAASVLASPLTLESLAAGTASDRDTLAQLAGVPQSGLVQVLPSTYASAPVGQLQSSGLGGDVDGQLQAGAQVLSRWFTAAPAAGTWVADGPLDAATASALAARHVTQLVVPAADLAPVQDQNTFAQATDTVVADYRVTVLAADAGLTADFTRPEPPVLAANHLLADMAMIQSEQPALTRAVVALPPSGWSADPRFVATLLAGLGSDPLLAPVTTTGAFAAAGPAVQARPFTGADLGGGGQAALGSADLAAIRSARSQIQALGAVLPGETAKIAALDRQLLLAESTAIGPAERGAVLHAIAAGTAQVGRQVSLPGSTSITLTSTKGQLPITILSSSSLRPRIQLRLTSERLIFQAFVPAGGTCRVPTPTSEICSLSLASQNTTLKVPVQTRSSGVFPLEVGIYSPDGTLRLAYNRDTVRSTAVSNVGLVLIVLAVLSLAGWWIRDLRHGRRARALVPAPVEAVEVPEEPAELAADPVLDEFFARPPPEYDQGAPR